MTVGRPWCTVAARNAACNFVKSWPPRFSASICATPMSATSARNSGARPKNRSKLYLPSLAPSVWYSPSGVSANARNRLCVLSRANNGSQSAPHSTLITFQPAPLNSDSSSWMIWPFPRTGPSSRCRLQLMTNVRLSRFSRAASVSAPSDSGSSISPSPNTPQTRRLAVSQMPRCCR